MREVEISISIFQDLVNQDSVTQADASSSTLNDLRRYFQRTGRISGEDLHAMSTRIHIPEDELEPFIDGLLQ